MAVPTADEQLLLELTNRIRRDPAGEFARLTGPGAQADVLSAMSYFGVSGAALEAQLGALTAVAPLAWSLTLADAARGHNALLVANDSQSHQEPGQPGLGQRATNAGYTGWSNLGENVFSYARDMVNAHAGFVIDWGYDTEDFSGGTLLSDWRIRGDGMQDPAGHRNSIMSATFREVGIAVTPEANPATSVGPYVVTQDFGTRFNYQAQFLGVVIDDRDGDDFYDVGEGLGGVEITLAGSAGTYATTSWASGGWQIAAPAGTYTLTFSGGGLAGSVVRTATLGSQNVKVDVEAADAMSVRPTAGNDVLAGTVGDDRVNALAGNDKVRGAAGADRLDGSAGDDRLYGDDGNDFLIGGGGADLVEGGAGDDRLLGDDGVDQLRGETGRDQLTGGAGADRFSFDDGDTGASGATADRILDFSRTDGDRIDLTAVDAAEGVGGDQAFVVIGAARFSGVAGELRVQRYGETFSVVFGDTDGDRIADFALRVDGPLVLAAGDFLL